MIELSEIVVDFLHIFTAFIFFPAALISIFLCVGKKSPTRGHTRSRGTSMAELFSSTWHELSRVIRGDTPTSAHLLSETVPSKRRKRPVRPFRMHKPSKRLGRTSSSSRLQTKKAAAKNLAPPSATQDESKANLAVDTTVPGKQGKAVVVLEEKQAKPSAGEVDSPADLGNEPESSQLDIAESATHSFSGDLDAQEPETEMSMIRPKKYALDEKQWQIAEGDKRDLYDYPTMADVLSDWNSVHQSASEMSKKQPEETTKLASAKEVKKLWSPGRPSAPGWSSSVFTSVLNDEQLGLTAGKTGELGLTAGNTTELGLSAAKTAENLRGETDFKSTNYKSTEHARRSAGVRLGLLPESKLGDDLTQKGDEAPFVKVDPGQLIVAAAGGTTFVHFTNHADYRLAFKVRCTSNKAYRLAPICGFMEPGQCIRLEVQRLSGPPKKDHLELHLVRAPPDASIAKQVFLDPKAVPLGIIGIPINAR